ncbi:hypothetical protein NVP1158O_28 [Vibrio phage 1.158.O._10N.261.45.E12]|nr:hypothetical protein NVP1158O_28 [Vibrio phage 1.158.O._10N.261.45.E12]AUR92657.1 hypothetical protein NVP1175O_29 [Vibrio phage 1.175.O._10N.261.55.B3]
MKTYETYQEAKIANLDKDICTRKGTGNPAFQVVVDGFVNELWRICNPADHCMTVDKFLRDGREFVKGDIYLNQDGRTLGVVNIPEYNNKRSTIDCDLYILRAAVLENQMNIDKVETQTEHQEEMSALISLNRMNKSVEDFLAGLKGDVEWNNGDFAIYEGSVVMVIAYHPKHPVIVVETSTEEYINVGICELSSPETPQQREERERLEAAYDLFAEWQLDGQTPIDTIRGFESFSKDKATVSDWLRVVDKTNYRKG